MKPLVRPQVNLNGTSREALVDQQRDVLDALRKLYEAMAEASPHGRDYQFRPEEYLAAREAWDERMLAVHLMMKDIEVHAMAIHYGEESK